MNAGREARDSFEPAASHVSEPVAIAAGRSALPWWARIHVVPTWWMEIVLIVVFDVVYEHVRNMVRLQPTLAIDHGLDVLRFTERLHLNFELSANKLLIDHQWLAQIANYDYSLLHLPLTAGTLAWVFWKHRDAYLRVRNVLLCTTILGLIGFYIFPMAPPRLLPGGQFIDTVVHFKTMFSYSNPAVADATNQFAAMPSLHCAWALWTGLCFFFLARNKVLRGLGLVYPVWTVFVVMGTANHFLLDAIAGIACVGASVTIVWFLAGRAPWSKPRRLEPVMPGARTAPEPG